MERGRTNPEKITVYDRETGKRMGINKSDYDPDKHALEAEAKEKAPQLFEEPNYGYEDAMAEARETEDEAIFDDDRDFPFEEDDEEE